MGFKERYMLSFYSKALESRVQKKLIAPIERSPTLYTITASERARREPLAPTSLETDFKTLKREAVSLYTWSESHDFELRLRALIKTTKDSLFFLGLTVPSSKIEAVEVFDLNALDAMKSFTSKLRDKVSCGHALRYVGAFERTSSKEALHAHILVEVPQAHAAAMSAELVQMLWRQVLVDLSKATGVDMFEADDGLNWKSDQTKPKIFCERAMWPLDAGRYCLKLKDYFTGEQSKVPLALEDGRLSAPKRWAFASRGLKKQADELAFSGHFEIESYDAAFVFIENFLVPLVRQFSQRAPWVPHFNDRRKLIGQRTWIAPESFDHLRRKLKRLHAEKLRTDFTTPVGRQYRQICVIELDLSGRFCCRVRTELNVQPIAHSP